MESIIDYFWKVHEMCSECTRSTHFMNLQIQLPNSENNCSDQIDAKQAFNRIIHSLQRVFNAIQDLWSCALNCHSQHIYFANYSPCFASHGSTNEMDKYYHLFVQAREKNLQGLDCICHELSAIRKQYSTWKKMFANFSPHLSDFLKESISNTRQYAKVCRSVVIQ